MAKRPARPPGPEGAPKPLPESGPGAPSTSSRALTGAMWLHNITPSTSTEKRRIPTDIPGNPGKIQIWGFGGVWRAIFPVNFIETHAQKLCRIILLRFGLKNNPESFLGHILVFLDNHFFESFRFPKNPKPPQNTDSHPCTRPPSWGHNELNGTSVLKIAVFSYYWLKFVN